MTNISYIFFTFLKIGATSFGGYMSLVAIVQRQLVDKDKILKEEDLLDGISLTSILPGPVAVNTIAYAGYLMGGIMGAIAAFIAIILPSFFLVLFLSWLYFTYESIPVMKNIFIGITLMITALIFTVACGMAKKTLKERSQWIIGIISAILLISIGGFALTFSMIVGSAIIGYFVFGRTEQTSSSVLSVSSEQDKQLLVPLLLALSLFAILVLWGSLYHDSPIMIKIFSTFAGSSLTLFGGGYVVIPAFHELFVDNLHWLTSSEFADGIAIGQITPGPIFITAAFIGYKVAGFWGALIATLAIFTPPAIVTVFLSRFMIIMNRSYKVKAAMKGVRASVIGMIFASAFIIGKTVDYSLVALFIFLLFLVISYKSNINPIYLIFGSGIVGLIVF